MTTKRIYNNMINVIKTFQFIAISHSRRSNTSEMLPFQIKFIPHTNLYFMKRQWTYGYATPNTNLLNYYLKDEILIKYNTTICSTNL
jgi:hypothetical protein